jgi:broad specificity phosphatase PhoE
VLLYIRHADDRRDDEYHHDRWITGRGWKKAQKRAAKLIARYGHPDVAYVSPYRRTRETLDAMTVLFGRPVVVRSDPRVAQYLGDRKRVDISPETRNMVRVDEDHGAFERRVAEHAREARGLPGVIWCVTHQAVVEKVAQHFGVAIPDKLDFLDHVVMER